MSYIQSLIKGNQTLTDKVQKLEMEVLSKNNEIYQLKMRNHHLQSKLERCEAELENIKNKQQPSSLEDMVNSSCGEIFNFLSKCR